MKDKLIGRYVIVRADKPGVFFGKLIEREGQDVFMHEVRKIYWWEGAAAVEQISLNGICKDTSKVTLEKEEMLIFGADQILPCSDECIKNLKGQKVWKI